MKKLSIKKAFTMVLGGIMAATTLISGMSVTSSAAKTSDPLNPNLLVNYVNRKVGSTVEKSSCLKFVADSVEAVYHQGRSSANCAMCYANDIIGKKNLKDPDNYDHIPLGADVFFSGSDVICKAAGHRCGHVAIYVGNGEIVHTWDGKVKKTTIDYVETHHKPGAPAYDYIGWAFHGNYNFQKIYDDVVKYNKIKNYNSGKMLNVVGNSSASGANVTVYQADGTTGQEFTATAHGTMKWNGTTYTKYVFTAKCSTNCALNVYGSTATAGANVNMWTKSGNDTQDWIITSVSGGYIIRSANNPNLVLTAFGTANGSNVKIDTYKAGNKNQIWSNPL